MKISLTAAFTQGGTSGDKNLLSVLAHLTFPNP